MIRIFSTGGTIDKVEYSHETNSYLVSEPQIKAILERSNIRLVFELEEICRKDSRDLTEQDRQLLAERVHAAAEKNIIITHGTDTVHETAVYLGDVKDKTVVFVGAMQPARFIDSDAAFNIGGAIIACQVLPAGIHLISNGLVLDPLQVRKNRKNRDYAPVR